MERALFSYTLTILDHVIVVLALHDCCYGSNRFPLISLLTQSFRSIPRFQLVIAEQADNPILSSFGFLSGCLLREPTCCSDKTEEMEYCMFCMCAEGIVAIFMGIFTIGAICPSVYLLALAAAQCVLATRCSWCVQLCRCVLIGRLQQTVPCILRFPVWFMKCLQILSPRSGR